MLLCSRCATATGVVHIFANRATAEALLQYLSNKFFAWGSGPGDDESVALEQRLQGGPASPALPGGAAPGLHSRHPRVHSPRRGARRASQAFSKSGMTHLSLFERYWRRCSTVAQWLCLQKFELHSSLPVYLHPCVIRPILCTGYKPKRAWMEIYFDEHRWDYFELALEPVFAGGPGAFVPGLWSGAWVDARAEAGGATDQAAPDRLVLQRTADCRAVPFDADRPRGTHAALSGAYVSGGLYYHLCCALYPLCLPGLAV